MSEYPKGIMLEGGYWHGVRAVAYKVYSEQHENEVRAEHERRLLEFQSEWIELMRHVALEESK